MIDAVVVGARCAGSATATALARAGRSVVMLDRVRFPADTISTHLLFPGGVAELARTGALARVKELGAPALRSALVGGAGVTAQATFTPVDGIDHGLCVRRPGLDAALVETARAEGVEVREGVRVTDLVREDGRVTGVRCDGGDEIRARLVVGADGRRSTIAKLVRSEQPYRQSRNGRACYYAYFADAGCRSNDNSIDEGERRDAVARTPGGGRSWRGVAAQWRSGAELGTAFPCDDGLVMVLVMPPVGRIDEFRADLQGAYVRTIRSLPGLAARLDGWEQATKVRSATDTTSYFRRSSGPGWALPGDAGHFKDPVTAQGIRDALRFGRLLGEAAAPVLDDPRALDAALSAWERRRQRECLETYQWTNALGRGEPMTPLEDELYRRLAHDEELTRELLDVFSRIRRPTQAFGARRAAPLAVAALRNGARPRSETLAVLARETRAAIAEATERRHAERAPLPASL